MRICPPSRNRDIRWQKIAVKVSQSVFSGLVIQDWTASWYSSMFSVFGFGLNLSQRFGCWISEGILLESIDNENQSGFRIRWITAVHRWPGNSTEWGCIGVIVVLLEKMTVSWKRRDLLRAPGFKASFVWTIVSRFVSAFWCSPLDIVFGLGAIVYSSRSQTPGIRFAWTRFLDISRATTQRFPNTDPTLSGIHFTSSSHFCKLVQTLSFTFNNS
jgi:hypothetical protein